MLYQTLIVTWVSVMLKFERKLYKRHQESLCSWVFINCFTFIFQTISTTIKMSGYLTDACRYKQNKTKNTFTELSCNWNEITTPLVLPILLYLVK